jgi:hypothetical protein
VDKKDRVKFNKIPSEVRDLEQYTDSELEGLVDIFENSNRVRSLIKRVVEKRLSRSILESETQSSYDSPNWALLQADNRGYRRALREVANIIYKDKE